MTKTVIDVLHRYFGFDCGADERGRYHQNTKLAGDLPAGDLAISEWVTTEVSSARSIKIRRGQIETSHRAAALAAFARLQSDSLLILPISPTHFRAAARFADQYRLGLRGGDALHLAIAAEAGATLVTLDRRLAQAALAIGVSASLL